MHKYWLAVTPRTVDVTKSTGFTGIRVTKNCSNKDFITVKYF